MIEVELESRWDNQNHNQNHNRNHATAENVRMAGVDSAPPEPASDEIELSAPPFRLPTSARTSHAFVPLSLAAILRSGSCRTSPSGHR